MKVGDYVTWLSQPRGGYGYVWPVNAKIIQIGPKKIKIEIETVYDEYKRIWVNPENLRR